MSNVVPLTDGYTVDVGTEEDLSQADAAAIYETIANVTALDAAALKIARGTLAYTDTAAKTLFTLPAGAQPVALLVNVTAPFDSDGTDLVDIGVGGDDSFSADVDVSSAGLQTLPFDDETALVADTAVTGIYAAGGSAANAGTATICALYYEPGS